MKGKKLAALPQRCLSCFSHSFSCFEFEGDKKMRDSERDPSQRSVKQHLVLADCVTSSASCNITSKSITFSMVEINKATSNFSTSCIVGQGGFGIVYKGKLCDGTIVAVKRARKDLFESQQTAQFQSEVNMLATIEHLNLVKLIGFLDRGNERIIVEEFVANGNLRQHLDCEFPIVLDLLMRLDIAIDIAHALTYLHFYADRPIIHRDVKASNILLTETFRAKVADFGFSRMGPGEPDVTHVYTQVKGTAGYLDPEYLKSYKLTTKSDVYAFGILLVELLTGRRPIEQGRSMVERVTIRWAYENFIDGNAISILDPSLEKSGVPRHVVETMFMLAFKCSSPSRSNRPTMKEVAEYLWSVRKEYQTLSRACRVV